MAGRALSQEPDQICYTLVRRQTPMPPERNQDYHECLLGFSGDIVPCGSVTSSNAQKNCGLLDLKQQPKIVRVSLVMVWLVPAFHARQEKPITMRALHVPPITYWAPPGAFQFRIPGV